MKIERDKKIVEDRNLYFEFCISSTVKMIVAYMITVIVIYLPKIFKI